MTERPILFSAPMVKAILAGTKTQTRRVVRPQPRNDGSGGVVREADSWIWEGGVKLQAAGYGEVYVHTQRHALERIVEPLCPFGAVGDRLWVREAWRVAVKHDQLAPRDLPQERGMTVMFEAGGSRAHDERGQYENDFHYPVKRPSWAGKLRPGMFMPRWASRLTLEVTGVRVQRLQEISEGDARAEGVQDDFASEAFIRQHGALTGRQHRYGLATLWDELHAHHGHSWASNPWVWVVEFKRVT